MSTKLPFPLKGRRKVEAVLSLFGPSQNKIRVVDLQSAPETEKFEMQSLPSFTAEDAKICAKESRLKNSAETLGREGREVSVLYRNVLDLAEHFKKVRAVVETV